MSKKLIEINDALLYKMRIARDQEAMKGNKMTLDAFYEKILSAGLVDHYNKAVAHKVPEKK